MFDVDSVFDFATGVKSLDTVNIVATNNSFWDMEENTTSFKTVAYANKKDIMGFKEFNSLCQSKVLPADMVVGERDKASDYGVLMKYDSSTETYKVYGKDGNAAAMYPAVIDGHELVGGN